MKDRIGRNEDGSPDEIVVHNVNVHIEQMDDGHWWMGIYKDDRVMLLDFYSKKKIRLRIDYNKIIDEQ